MAGLRARAAVYARVVVGRSESRSSIGRVVRVYRVGNGPADHGSTKLSYEGPGPRWERAPRQFSCPAARPVGCTGSLVEHRDRFCRLGSEYVQAALAAQGRELVVVDAAEVDDDLVRDMTEI